MQVHEKKEEIFKLLMRLSVLVFFSLFSTHTHTHTHTHTRARARAAIRSPHMNKKFLYSNCHHQIKKKEEKSSIKIFIYIKKLNNTDIKIRPLLVEKIV
jgi:hypothetical protein